MIPVYNKRSARVLVTPARPSPHRIVGGDRGMATYKPIPNFSSERAARFWALVDRSGESSCWPWRGAITAGYGMFSPFRAHRVAYTLLCGPIPAGLMLDHLCRNRACVNPAHLRPCTNRENVLAAGSESRTAINAAKTACPLGHPYDSVNTYNPAANNPARQPDRRCRACDRLRRQSERAAKRANPRGERT
jgi:hypothetical protein